MAIGCQNFSLIQNRKKQLKYLCKRINILLVKNLSDTKDKNVSFSSLIKSFPLGYLFQVTGASYVLFLLFLDCSRASLPSASVSLEVPTPAILLPHAGAGALWCIMSLAKPCTMLIQSSALSLSSEQSFHQHWMLFKVIFTSVSIWKVSYVMLFMKFKDKEIIRCSHLTFVRHL